MTYKLDEALSYSFRMFFIALQCLVEHTATNNEYTRKYEYNTSGINMLNLFTSTYVS